MYRKVPAHRALGARGRTPAGQGCRHHRQDDHPPRQRQAEGILPAARDRARRDRVRDRLQRAAQAGSTRPRCSSRPLRDGDGWRLNGRKIWTTSAHFADWYWVGARTDPDAPKHKGITLFLVEMRHPGITIQPTWTIGDERTNEVFIDDVVETTSSWASSTRAGPTSARPSTSSASA
ncbi:MAG: acyl-CoA dehydrogenase family protein [bacterium]